MDRLQRMLNAAQMGGGGGGPAQVSSIAPSDFIFLINVPTSDSKTAMSRERGSQDEQEKGGQQENHGDDRSELYEDDTTSDELLSEGIPEDPDEATEQDEAFMRSIRVLDFTDVRYNKQDTPLVDNAETVYISSLALLKMLRHGRAGVPMEVMGLMLGEFVDDYTVRVVDVFAMPQSGTGVSVEAVDPVFQTKMMDMLRQTGRPETVVGWYHSHPGFGCWLSSVDINTQQSFEQLTPRAVAVVVDPIQSVKGKVVIDAFRLINPQTLMMGHEPRQTTSNIGHLNKPSIQALIHGLNRHYYSISIAYRKSGLEENMLMNLHKSVWTDALQMEDFKLEGERNAGRLKQLVGLAEGYEKRVKEESELTKEQLRTRYVGRVDPKKHIETVGQQLIEDNIVSVSRQMIDKEASVPKSNGAANGHANGIANGGMDIDEEL